MKKYCPHCGLPTLIPTEPSSNIFVGEDYDTSIETYDLIIEYECTSCLSSCYIPIEDDNTN